MLLNCQWTWCRTASIQLRISHPASMTSNALKRLQQVELFSKRPNENPMLELLGTSEPVAARVTRRSRSYCPRSSPPLCCSSANTPDAADLPVLFATGTTPNRNNGSRTAKIDFTSCHMRQTKSHRSFTLSASHAQLPPCSFIHMQGRQGATPDRAQS